MKGLVKLMKEIKKNIKYCKDVEGLLLNPETFMHIVYGHDKFYIRQNYEQFEKRRILLGSRVGHAGQGCIPGRAAVVATVDKIEEVKPRLYRYSLKDIDVFEPEFVRERDGLISLKNVNLNMLDSPENDDWLENYLYPYINGAYINYQGEWVIPEPEYV